MLNASEKWLIAGSVALMFFLMYSFVEGIRVTYHCIFMVNESDLPLGKMSGYMFLFLFETVIAGLIHHLVTEFGKKDRFLKLKTVLYKYLRSSTS